MRQVLTVDILAVAHHLEGIAPDRRLKEARNVISRARLADLYRKKTGRRHNAYGDGSLMAAIAGRSLPSVAPGLVPDAVVPLLIALSEVNPTRN